MRVVFAKVRLAEVLRSLAIPLLSPLAREVTGGARSVSPHRDRGGFTRAGAVGISGERVLVIDDEPQIRRALNSALVAHGYAITIAENGVTALRAIAPRAPDAVVVDLVMPCVDGFDVLC
jgi:PleD family two-component response regulator